VCSALARRITTHATFGAALEYTKRIAAEYQVLLVKDTVRMKPELRSSSAFVAWAVDNSWLVQG